MSSYKAKMLINYVEEHYLIWYFTKKKND